MIYNYQMKIDWNNIHTILLDMDGTLLDRRFDDHFWLEHVPLTYANRNGIPLQQSKEKLYSLFKSQEKTLNWTDLDYWSDRLGLDIPLLKEDVDHLIAIHPFVVEFLLFLKSHGKQTWLVTNAHSKTLSLKLRKTRIGQYFSGIVSAHELGLPKEEPAFWKKLQEKVSYDPESTMLGEDSESNLESAESFGISYLIFVSRSNSALTPSPSLRFPSIHYFSELIPFDGTMSVSISHSSR